MKEMSKRILKDYLLIILTLLVFFFSTSLILKDVIGLTDFYNKKFTVAFDRQLGTHTKSFIKQKKQNRFDYELRDWVLNNSKGSDIFLVPFMPYFFNELNFELFLNRPTVAVHKFDPTNKKHLKIWYLNLDNRRQIFKNGCNAKFNINFKFLIIDPVKYELEKFNCLKVVFRNHQYVVLENG